MTLILIAVVSAAVAFPPTPESLAKLCLSENEAIEDRTLTDAWAGAGKTQLKIAHSFADRRDALFKKITSILTRLAALVDTVGKAEDLATKETISTELVKLADELKTAEKELADVIHKESIRIKMLEAAARQAQRTNAELPGLNLALLEKRREKIKTEEFKKNARNCVHGFSDFALGLAAFLKSDFVNALKHMEASTTAIPGFSKAHEYLGSFYYMARSPLKALSEWEKALRLDPGNKELMRTVEAQRSAIGR